MSVSKFLKPSCLNKLLQGNTAGLKVLDCTYNVTPKPDYIQWKKQYYGMFEELMNKDSVQKQLFLQSHIPTARLFDLDIAMYPTRFERLAHYPPDVFQEYMQLLGLYNDDQLILYSRDRVGGMLFSGKCYWLLKTYGHKNIEIVDGGLEAWEKEGFETESCQEMPKIERGTWIAKNYQHRLISFEELTEKDESGKDILQKTEEYNLLDTRIRSQFNNEGETGLNAFVVPGSFIPGTHNTPVVELVGSDGYLLPEETIKERLAEVNFDQKKPTITLCNSGVQAALYAAIIENIYPNQKIRLYNGSMKEIEIREPQRISGGVKPVSAF